VHDATPISAEDVRALVYRALYGMVVGDIGAAGLFTDDVHGDSPGMCVRSRTELEFALEDRAGVLSNVEFVLVDVDETDRGLIATWRASGNHTGAALFNEDKYFEPSGQRIAVSATTHVTLRDGRIEGFRTDYDEGDVFDQFRGGPSRGGP